VNLLPNLNEVLKQLALETYVATQPSGIYFGTVISSSPLKISVDQKLTLTEKHLILTTLVQDFSVNMTVDHKTENKSGGSGDSSFASHNHDYKGTKSFRVHLALKVGEKVMLIRVQGGQKYIVLDRIRG
jgi:hypothetical protein